MKMHTATMGKDKPMDDKNKKVSVDSILSREEKKPAGPAMAGGAAKPESKGMSKDPKAKKAKHKMTHIEHHPDGSHTVRHTPMGGGEEVSYSKPDLDGVHDGLEEHMGQDEPGMDQNGPDMPQGAAPAQQPMPAAPMAGA